MNTTTLSTDDIVRNRISDGLPKRHHSTAEKPMNTMPMTVTLDQLSPSAVLPRFKKNALYDDIKASIRSKGLDHAPVITTIPGREGYVISDGGNTRLQILNELYSETNDPKFFSIQCLFRPWRGELKSIIGHLTENGLRDDYTFIEKAIGVAKSKEIYESELGKNLSVRELSDLLKKDGYPISFQLVSRMLSTIELLYPYIPEVLKQGLGKSQIDKILTLRTVCEDIYTQANKFPDTQKFVESFNLILTECDFEPEFFNYDHLQDTMFGYFSKELGIRYNVFSFALDEKGQKGKKLPPIDIYQHSKTQTAEQSIIDNGVKGAVNQSQPIVHSNNTYQSHDPQDNSVKVTQFENDNGVHTQSQNENAPNHSGATKPQTSTNEKEIIDEGCSSFSNENSNGIDFKQAVETFQRETDFKKLYPKDFSITANMNTFGRTEKVAILDIWQLTDELNDHVSVFGEIFGLIVDICDELKISSKITKSFFYDKETQETRFEFDPLSSDDAVSSTKATAYKLLTSLLTSNIEDVSVDLSHFITNFNDFTVIKFFRIIRLKRVYDQFLKQFETK